MRMGKAERAEARHNDAEAFEDAIKDWRAAGGTGTPWIAVESLYSMDGDRAPLDELADIAARHEGVLIIDEAHATGFSVRWAVASARISKAATTSSRCTPAARRSAPSGALVLRAAGAARLPRQSCSRPSSTRRRLRRSWRDRARGARHLPFRCSAARKAAVRLVAFAGAELEASCGLQASGSHIQPVIVGADERASALAAAMQRRGFDIRAVRPPTVPEGTARLRLSLTLNVDEAKVAEMASALAEELKRLDV